MNEYAKLKGGATAPVSGVASGQPALPRPLSDAETDRVAENRAFVHEHLPELVPFIKDLHAEGLIDGWRAIGNCKLSDSK